MGNLIILFLWENVRQEDLSNKIIPKRSVMFVMRVNVIILSRLFKNFFNDQDEFEIAFTCFNMYSFSINSEREEY